MNKCILNPLPILHRQLTTLACLAGLLWLAMPGSALAEEITYCSPDRDPSDVVSVEYGELVACKMRFLGDYLTFEFEGREGDKLWLYAAKQQPSYVIPCIWLSGVTEAETCQGDTVSLVGILPSDGMFRGWVYQPRGSNRQGNYSFVVDRLSPASPAAKSVRYGELVDDQKFEIGGDLDLFTFRGNIGQQVEIVVDKPPTSSYTDPCLWVTGPDGGHVDSACSQTPYSILLELERAGLYTLSLYEAGANTIGAYSVEINCKNCVDPPVECDLNDDGVFDKRDEKLFKNQCEIWAADPEGPGIPVSGSIKDIMQ